jgi:redox-sensitive bicupin YhaK (pirin superfamily)
MRSQARPLGGSGLRHHFAVGPYGNEAHKPLGNLIVLNDDEIAPHAGFGLHPHANVEIVTYVHDGIITHRDDQGNVGTVRAGDVQVMSAGTGISHSERNEGDSPVRMFQIWLRPNQTGGDAGYLVLATGAVEVNRVMVQAREGLVIESETLVSIRAIQDSEFVLVVTAC